MDRKALHYDVFLGKTDYIPLTIKLPVDPAKKASPWKEMHDPEYALRKKMEEYGPLYELQTDFVPFIESNFLECLVPSLFGAKAYESPGGLIDVKPIFEDVEELENLEVPDLMGGMMPQAIEHLRYLKAHAPEWLSPQISRMLSPLDAGAVMCGGEFFLNLAMEPEITAHFMDVMVETNIGVVKILKEVIDQPLDECITIRGLHYPGFRITNDAIVNISPAMIREMYDPCMKKFKDAFGNLMLHYCCTPAPSGHVLPALVAGGLVNAVDNWQGFETFFNNEQDKLQDQVAICTDIPFETMMNFEEYANKTSLFSQVKRRGGRGLTITTTAPSEAEARRLWKMWEKRKNYRN